MPVPAAKKVLTAARQKQTAEELAALLQQDVFNLSGQLDDCNRIVQAYREKDSIWAGMGERLAKMERLQADQRRAYEAEVKRLNRDLRRARSGRKWTAVLGVIGAGLAVFIMK